jgi:hypothetical protein
MSARERPAAPGLIEKEWTIDHEPDLREIFGDIREDAAAASSREDLTQLYRRAEYLRSARETGATNNEEIPDARRRHPPHRWRGRAARGA